MLMRFLETYGAVIVDEDSESLTLEATGDAAKISDLLNALERFGIRELAQSGLVAIERGSGSLADRTLSTQSIPTADSGQADYQKLKLTKDDEEKYRGSNDVSRRGC
jgi:hypothetical protein